MQGMLLPKAWPRKVSALRLDELRPRALHALVGLSAGEARRPLVLLETPDDAGCPLRASGRRPDPHRRPLGPFAGPLVAIPAGPHVAFLDEGNYVDLAKRYRRSRRSRRGTFRLAQGKDRPQPAGRPAHRRARRPHQHPLSYPAGSRAITTRRTRPRTISSSRSTRGRRELRALAGQGRRPGLCPPGRLGRARLRQSPSRRPAAVPRGGRLGRDEALRRRLRRAGLRLRHPRSVPRLLSGRADLQSPPRRDGRRTAAATFDSTWYGGVQTFLCSSLAPGYVRRKNYRDSWTTGSRCAAPISTSSPSSRPTNATTPNTP